MIITDPVHTVLDPYRHDMKFDSFKTNVALKFMISLDNLETTNHRKSGKGKNDRKLTEHDVVTARIRISCKRGHDCKVVE